ncbi:MAG: hypothetical protein Q4G65_07185 [bacterium]|nr:hypothetical protein [bacterium]
MKKTLLALGLLALLPTSAQWIEQVVNLKKGWNGVHLKVNPADTSCAKVFAGTSVESVTWWNRDRRDDGTGIAPTATSLNWYRVRPEASTFGRMIGGHTYIIKAPENQIVRIVGTPARPRTKTWLGEMNLAGLWIPSGSRLFYPDYYAGFLDKLSGNPFYTISATTGDPVLANVNTPIAAADQAIWIETKGAGEADWAGPLQVELSTATEILDWEADTEVRRLKVTNRSGMDRPLRIRLEGSLPPPAGQGVLAGPVTLLKEEIDWSAGFARRVYVPCTFPIATNIAAGATLEFGFRPDLQTMGHASGHFQGILSFDDAGVVLDGSALPNGSVLHRVGVRVNGDLAASRTPAGLWLGNVTLTGVNRARPLASASVTNAWDSSAIQPANQPFSFRLLVHVDAMGRSTLLKEVYVASDGSGADPVLLVSRADAVQWRNGHPRAKIRRVSSANFHFFGEPLAMEGGLFAQPDAKLTCAFRQGFDDKVNPFVHQFHPNHDNVRFRNKKMEARPDGDSGTGDFESWSVRRSLELTFAAEDPLGANYDWNGTVTGGTYKETVTTLIKDGVPIITTGLFRLTKIAGTTSLTRIME